MLSIAAFLEGRHAQAFPSFGSERTGAPVVAYCRIDEREIRTREPISEPDALIVQDPTLLHQVDVFSGLCPDGYILINSSRGIDELGLADLEASASGRSGCSPCPPPKSAREHLGRPLPNAVLLGGFAATHRADLDRFGGGRDPREVRRPDRRRATSAPPRRRSSSCATSCGSRPVLRQEEGSSAVAEAVAICRPEVICAYPISPQTHIVERLSDLVRTGELEPCEYVKVESEFAAMSVAIGASAAGARAYTATASQGLLYMAEALYNASGLGLPIVMTVANRAIGAPINIWNDHTDTMSQRDSGWIQLYAETNQEALDLHIQAFRLAEELSLPVMVCMDGFILTHAYERVDVPEPEQVDAFLPPFEPRQVLDPADPVTIGAMVGPEAFFEVKYLAHAKQMQALDLIPGIAAEFAEAFGRESGGLLRTYRAEDAETIVVALGSVLGTIEETVDELRERGRDDRGAGDQVVPAVPARGGARGAGRRRAGGRPREGAGGRGRRHRLGQRADGAVGDPAARLHGDRRARRAGDHQGVAATAVRRRRRRPARAADLPRHGLGAGRARAGSVQRERAASGPHEENMLRDIGVVAARPH